MYTNLSLKHLPNLHLLNAFRSYFEFLNFEGIRLDDLDADLW